MSLLTSYTHNTSRDYVFFSSNLECSQEFHATSTELAVLRPRNKEFEEARDELAVLRNKKQEMAEARDELVLLRSKKRELEDASAELGEAHKALRDDSVMHIWQCVEDCDKSSCNRCLCQAE